MKDNISGSGPTVKVTCVKGTQEKTYDFAVESKLDKVREELARDGFMPPDQDDIIAYRFVDSQSKAKKVGENIIGPNLERVLSLKDILGARNRLVITNISASKKPDLFGTIEKKGFINSRLAVSIALNYDDPQASKTNTDLGAFEPVMLSHVQPTNEALANPFENVCVCVNRSIVSFTICSWGAAGFEVSIASQAQPIVKDIYHSLGDTPNRVDASTFRRYSGQEKTIEIVGLDELPIARNQRVRYQLVTFKTRRMTAYRKDGRYYQSTQNAPQRLESELEACLEQHLLQAKVQNRAIVPGEGMKPATFQPGPRSEQKFGTIYDMKTDGWDPPLGIMKVHFFVFNTWDEAKQVIGGSDLSVPDLWS